MVGPVPLDGSVLFPDVLRDTLLTLAEHVVGARDLFGGVAELGGGEPRWESSI